MAHAQKLILLPRFQRQLTQALKTKIKDEPAANEAAEMLIAYLLANTNGADRNIKRSAAFVFDAEGEADQKYKIAVMASLIRYGVSRKATHRIFVSDTATDKVVTQALSTLTRFYGPMNYVMEIKEEPSYRDIRSQVTGAKVLVHPDGFDLDGAPEGLSVNFDEIFLLPLQNLNLGNMIQALMQALVAA